MPASETPELSRLYILESSLYVDDLEAAEAFYVSQLRLEFVSRDPERHLFLRCGPGMLLLFLASVSRQGGGGFPAHGADGPGHVAFGVTPHELAAWEAYFEQQQVPIEHVINWPAGGRSIYLRDPAGNSLELATPQLWGL